MLDAPLTEAERFPLLTDRGRAMLSRLRQHEHAPRWTYSCGERLTEAGLADVQAFAARQGTERRRWKYGKTPAWVGDFIDRCRRDVPFYRQRLIHGRLPTCDREDLRREPWSFVPDSADLNDLIVYKTSGTSGNLLHLPSHPVAPARYLPLFESALAAHGVALTGGDCVSLLQVAAQIRTYTFASISSYLREAGHAKINLNPADWFHADDRRMFFDDCSPELVTGDPFALEQLAELELRRVKRSRLFRAIGMDSAPAQPSVTELCGGQTPPAAWPASVCHRFATAT